MSKVVMTLMRAQPPTIGHELLVKKMDEFCDDRTDQKIFLSASHDHCSNPLSFDYRYELASKAFNGVSTAVSPVPQKDWFSAIRFVYNLGYSELIAIVGGDRFTELNKRIPMYNGTEYKFSSIKVYNAGQRDDSDSVAGMSASKLREAAKLGDYDTFESGLPNKLRSMSSDIYQRIREACHTSLLT